MSNADEPKCGDCPHTVKVSKFVPEWVYGVDWYGECDLYYDGRHADQRNNPICEVRCMELALIARVEAAEKMVAMQSNLIGMCADCCTKDMEKCWKKAQEMERE